MRIRDGDSSDLGSGMEKSRIRDPGLTSRIRNTAKYSKYADTSRAADTYESAVWPDNSSNLLPTLTRSIRVWQEYEPVQLFRFRTSCFIYFKVCLF